MRLCTLALSALISTHALAQSGTGLNFVATELPRPPWPQQVHIADMDGDGLEDIVVPFWSADSGRQLHIFLQDNAGRFPSQPSRIVDIRSEIVAVALADVREQAGTELLLFTGSSAFSLSSALPGYSNNLRHLFDWPLTAAVPDPQQIRWLQRPRDVTGDGFVDLLLPGVDNHGWFTGAEDEQFTLTHQFSTLDSAADETDLPPASGRISSEISFNAQDGLKVDVQLRSASLFENFLQFGSGTSDALLEIDHWMPAALMAPMSAANSNDLVFLNMGADLQGQINIKQMKSDGSFDDEPDWRGAVEMRGDFRLMDSNGDGVSDIVRLSEDGDNWSVAFYLNKQATFDFSRADQVMRFSGYDLRVTTGDLLGNNKPQLIVSYYTIPLVNAIRDASIMRTTLLFNTSDNGGLFNTRPDFMLEERFSAATVRGLSTPIILDTDLDADGRIDALYVTTDGALAARRINDDLRFDNTPFWHYVPERSISRFRVQDLNADGRPDLILDHSNTITVLVSAP